MILAAYLLAALGGTEMFQLAATGLGVIGILSAAAVVSRSTVLTTNNSQLRNAYKDAKDQLSDLQKELATCRIEKDEAVKRAALLENIVTGREELRALASQMGTLRQDLQVLIEEMAVRAPGIEADRGTRGGQTQPSPRRPPPRRRPGDSGGSDL